MIPVMSWEKAAFDQESSECYPSIYHKQVSLFLYVPTVGDTKHIGFLAWFTLNQIEIAERKVPIKMSWGLTH